MDPRARDLARANPKARNTGSGLLRDAPGFATLESGVQTHGFVVAGLANALKATEVTVTACSTKLEGRRSELALSSLSSLSVGRGLAPMTIGEGSLSVGI